MRSPDFQKMAAEKGWDASTQVEVLLEYIENQQSPEAFNDFLLEQEAVDAMIANEDMASHP